MTVLHHDPVLALVSGLDLGDGEHDHVVVVAVRHHLVSPALLADGGALTTEEWAVKSLCLEEYILNSKLFGRLFTLYYKKNLHSLYPIS